MATSLRAAALWCHAVGGSPWRARLDSNPVEASEALSQLAHGRLARAASLSSARWRPASCCRSRTVRSRGSPWRARLDSNPVEASGGALAVVTCSAGSRGLSVVGPMAPSLRLSLSHGALSWLALAGSPGFHLVDASEAVSQLSHGRLARAASLSSARWRPASGCRSRTVRSRGSPWRARLDSTSLTRRRRSRSCHMVGWLARPLCRRPDGAQPPAAALARCALVARPGGLAWIPPR